MTLTMFAKSEISHCKFNDSKLLLTLLSANPTKWSNTVFDHFVILALEGLNGNERPSTYLSSVMMYNKSLVEPVVMLMCTDLASS